MSDKLEEYARKRKFDRTPEPPPAAAGPTGRAYCIQRHDARRLHYDLRLEIGGTLKSWAVPQGPTLDPAEKRLAVMVEDHPLDYGGFEGNIPAGNYGAGSVMLWDRGWWELLGDKTVDEQLERGDLKFRLHGEKLQGDFALVRMKSRGKGNEWLIIKKRDAFAQPGWDIEQHAQSALTGRTQEEIAREMPARASEQAVSSVEPEGLPGAVRAELPRDIAPMQAYPVKQTPRGKDWLFEIKWDGVRALCFIEGGTTHLHSRRGNAMDRQYPELSVLHHYVNARAAILDGEIAVLDEAGRPSFAALQPRMMATDPNAVAHLTRSRPVTLFLFDLLYLDGYDLRQVPLVERKRALKAVLRPDTVVRYSEHFEGRGEELLAAAREKGLEGIMAKKATSRYEPRRTEQWLKIKITEEQEFVICGYTAGERDFFGALVLGVWNEGVLEFAGCVGTGFDRKLMEAIHRALQPLIVDHMPFAEPPDVREQITWVRPELVCTVRFSNWTEDGRLRAPVFVGMRPDIDPRECVRDPKDAPAEVTSPLEDTPPTEASAPTARGPLIPEGRAEATVEVEGRTLRFKNLSKIFYPREGYAKRDILNYYDAVADLLSPHLKDRPLSLKRYPNGIESEFFFQKDTSAKGFPDWVRTAPVAESERHTKQYAIGADRPTLLYLANLGCIDQNPWMSRVGSLENPDFILIDLDPHECGFDRIVEAAQLVRQKLDLLGLSGYPKTTGGDGMHVYVPVQPVYSHEQTRTFAEIIARVAAAERPDLFTTPRSVAKREKGKVYFDYLQNAYGKTIAAPYVLRAYPGAPVATPLEWGEVKRGLEPAQFHIGNAVARFERKGDLFAGVLRNPQRLEPAMERLDRLVRGPARD